jgi:thiamine transport system ATP-binding protein
MKGLDIHDVSLSYDTVQVLDHVSLSVDDGHIVAVLGPSGSGKSSLLRVIAGLIPTASGSVSVKGVDVTSLPTHKRGVGMVFQNNQLFPHLNVEGNVGYGLRIAGVKRSVIAERVADLLSLVGLDSHVKRDVATLSGGEAARVALARSLATEPAVLLLDEPLSGLDHDLKYPLADELRRVIKTAGITAVIVTHDPVEAERIADRTVRMSELSSNAR